MFQLSSCNSSAMRAVVGPAKLGGLPQAVSTTHLRWLAASVSDGSAEAEVLRDKRDDVLTARVRLDKHHSVIVKLWNRPSWRGGLRRLTRTNTGYREWCSLRMLCQRGAYAPRPLGYFRLRQPTVHHTEALITEDLGPCTNAARRAKQLLWSEQYELLERFENDLIAITLAMVSGGLIDTDHRLSNFVVTEAGRMVRLDLEHGTRVLFPNIWPNRYGIMLGVLVGSYAFAMQPAVSRAWDFAARLADRLMPPRRVLRRARRKVEAMLNRQRIERGIDTRVSLPW